MPQLVAVADESSDDATASRDDATASTTPSRCASCDAALAPGVTFCTSCGESLAASDPLIGRVLDERYEVLQRLGAGAMGAVYEVRHLRLNKRFAMKVIHRELTQIPEFLARFEREALSTSRLQHPNCILVTDFGHASTGELYLVMEFLEGKPLSDLLDRPLPVGQALEITRQILLGVQHAHEAGVIHRDLKPENAFRVEKPDGSWQIKVVDFGIAKLPLGAPGSEQEPLTKAGVVFGTPEYMAPEQALGGDVGPAADVYAVGVILWRLLTGRALFEVEGHVEVLSAKLAEPARSLEKVAPGVFTPALVQLLARALERKPSERLARADEFITALEVIQRAPGAGRSSGPGPTARRDVATGGRGLPHAAATLVSGWYHCAGQSATPTWRLRATSLVTTSRGAAVLGSVVTVVALLVVLTFVLSARSAVVALPPTPFATRPDATPATPAKKIVTPPPGTKPGAGKKGDPAAPPTTPPATVGPFDPEARALYLLGVSLSSEKSWAKGLDAYRQAISREPRYRSDARLLYDAGLALQATNPKVRRAALDFLGGVVGQAALPTLLEAVARGDRALRKQVLEQVRQLGGEGRVDWVAVQLHELAHAPSCAERRQAVLELQRLKNSEPRVLEALRRARNERSGSWFRRAYKNWCIRKEIVAALKELQGNASTTDQGDGSPP